jgi:hypothetical protein
MRLVAFVVLSVLLAGCDQSSDDKSAEARKARSAATSVTVVSSQAERTNIAEEAFKQIDVARGDYPPLGVDPTSYNANVTKAYRAWERAAEAAYGTNWKSIWRTKHAGSGVGCGVAHKFGMPLEACYEAAASEGDIEALDGMLMKCPSWNDPSGVIFDPHDPAACATRRKAMAPVSTISNLDHTTIAVPSSESAPSGDAVSTSPPSDAAALSDQPATRTPDPH